jgi:hypothetical protein
MTVQSKTEVPILLDSGTTKIVLDGLGAIALFAVITLAMSVDDAVLVTATMGSIVLVTRAVRFWNLRSTSQRHSAIPVLHRTDTQVPQKV